MVNKLATLRASVTQQVLVGVLLYTDTFFSQAWEVREAQSVKELLDSAPGGKSQLGQVERSIDIGLLCSQEDPMERPTMLDVLKMLNSEERPPAPPRPSFI